MVVVKAEKIRVNLGTFNLSNSESFELNLISPFTTSNGKTYFYLDANGDGKSDSTPGITPDAILREGLDSLFNSGADTTTSNRSVTIGSYKLTLPTIAELSQIRTDAIGKPPIGWTHISGIDQVSTYHSADLYAPNSHTIFGLTNGTPYARDGLEIDNVSKQFVAIQVEFIGNDDTFDEDISGGGDSSQNHLTDFARIISSGSFPDVAVLENGDYVVAWKEFKSTYDVEGYFQRFNSIGAAVTDKIIFSDGLVQINTIVSAKSDGGFIVGGLLGDGNNGYAWTEYNSNNVKINSSMNFVGELGASYGYDGLVFADNNVFSTSHMGGWDSILYIIDQNGSKSTFNVATNSTGSQVNPKVIPLSDTNKQLIIWSDFSQALDTSGSAVYGRVFSSNSKTFETDPFLINQTTYGYQGGWGGTWENQTYTVASLPNNGFSIFWMQTDQGEYTQAITNGQYYGRFFNKDSTGFYGTNEIRLSNIEDGAVTYADSTSLPNGNLLVIYNHKNTDQTYSLYGKVFSTAGEIYQEDFFISNFVDGYSFPRVDALTNESAIATWQKNSSPSDNFSGSIVDQIFVVGENQKNDMLSLSRAGTILGLGGNDFVSGSSMSDQIFGGMGNDVLNGGSGSDLIDGGDGNDTADFSQELSDVVINLSSSDTFSFVAGHKEDSLLSIENLTGGSGNDTLSGDENSNQLKGGKGKDVLKGDGGNDRVDGGEGDDLIIGGDGKGDDVYIGGAGEDTVMYTSATEAITVNLFRATGVARANNTSITDAAGIGIDKLYQIENIIAGDFNDMLIGSGVANVIKGGLGKDTIDGGAGSDTADYSEQITAVLVTLNGAAKSIVSVNGSAEDIIINIENIIGGLGNDMLTGDRRANSLSGGNGNDALKGAAGADTLDGGSGNDFLSGGAGRDELLGGSGADQFVFDAALNSRTNSDTIVDFSSIQGDKLVLEDRFFIKFKGGITSDQVRVNTTGRAEDSSDHLIFNSTNGKLFYDPDGSGRGSAIEFATLIGVSTLSHDDFFII